MAIKSAQELKEKRELPVLNTNGILALRYYRHYKGGIYYINGFAIHEKTGKTTVIYTDGYTGTPFVRFAEEFTEKVEGGVLRFELVEKK